jgi:hypothetical protein
MSPFATMRYCSEQGTCFSARQARGPALQPSRPPESRASGTSHVGDVENHAFRVEKRDRQRQVGIHHPHRVQCDVREDEQHAAVFRQHAPVHQTDRALRVGARDLGRDLVCANGERDFREFRLRSEGNQQKRRRCERPFETSGIHDRSA